MKTKLKSVALFWVYFLMLFFFTPEEPTVKADNYNVEIKFNRPVAESVNSEKHILMYVNGRVSLSAVSEELSPSSKCEDNYYAEVRNGIIYAKNVGTTIVSDGKNRVKLSIFKENISERKKHKLTVYKESQTVVVYTADVNGDYTVPVRCMPCSTGTEGENETKSGEYTVRAHYRWRLLYGPCYGQYGTSISSNYLFHSMPYEEMKPNTVYDYELLGQKASHGCIRLSAADAKWIFDNCDIDSTVTVTDEDCEKAVISAKLNEDERYSGWDPTDPDDENPYLIDGMVYFPVTAVYSDKLNLLAGERVKIDIKTTASSLKMTSDDPSVAGFDDNGIITAKRSGCCTVYIMGNDGSYCKAEVVVD